MRTAAERTGAQADPQAMLWQTLAVPSVTLQREQFQVLAGYAPTSADEVAGRLGNPLSETPEFWRAAPEAAVDWSAEELEPSAPTLPWRSRRGPGPDANGGNPDGNDVNLTLMRPG